MRAKPISPRVLLVLIAAAVLTPIAVCVVVALGRLLAAMGDAQAAGVLDWIAVAVGALWLVDLISLVLALAVNAVSEPADPPEPE